MVLECSALVDMLPYDSTLLEESLAFIYGVEDPQKMAPKDSLVRHLKDPLSPWRDFPELLRRCEDIILSLTPTTPLLTDIPSLLAHPIVWRPPDVRIILVGLFGGIGAGLAAVLEAGLIIRRYVYVDNSQVSTRVARRHFL